MKEKIIIHQKIPKPTKIVYKQFKSIIKMTTLRTISLKNTLKTETTDKHNNEKKKKYQFQLI